MGSDSRGAAAARWRLLVPSFKHVFAIMTAGICSWLVFRQLEELDFTEVAFAFSAVSPLQWYGALLATALSFLAVGRYDALFHRWLGTGVPQRRAAICGAAAIALAQTLGMGLATGTVARWRALPELSVAQALKVTNYVSFSFMVALAFVSALVFAFVGFETKDQGIATGLAFSTVASLMVLSVSQPSWLPFPLPPSRLILRLTTLTAVDTALAGFALWILLPADVHLPFPVLFAAFLAALGAGLLSGAPGGVGPFELCLVTLLPTVPEGELIAAVLAFRLVYYAIPACLSLAVLARGPKADKAEERERAVRAGCSRAEAGLARQNGSLKSLAGRHMHLIEATQSLVSVGDPVDGHPLAGRHLSEFSEKAGSRLLWPVLYKCGGRSSVVARRKGWTVMPVSEEAWLDPRSFSLEGAARRQLRRKVKQSERNGVMIELSRTLPIPPMNKIASEWAIRCGGERGFSMGRFDPTYLSEQRCYLAWHGNELVAFVSFHIASDEWALDLMRSGDNVPDGTMHALVAAAIRDAGDQGIARLSLAAMPLDCPPLVLRWLASRREAQGLRRFKMSFAPNRKRLYVAAQNPAVLALAGIDIVLRITRPAPLSSNDASSDVGYDEMAPVPVLSPNSMQ